MSIRLWGTESVVNGTTANNQSSPVVTALQDGGYVVAWVDDNGAGASAVRFQRYDAGGNKAGAETTVAGPDADGDQDQVSICTLANGSFVVAHRDVDGGANAAQIALTQYSSNGGFLGQTVASTAFQASQPSVQAEGTGFRLSLTNNLSLADTDVYTYSYDANAIQQAFNTIDATGATLDSLPDVESSQSWGLVAVYSRDTGGGSKQVMLKAGTESLGFAGTGTTLSSFGGLPATSVVEGHVAYIGQRPDGSGSQNLFVFSYNIFNPVDGYSNSGGGIVRSNGTYAAGFDQFQGTLTEILVQKDQTFYLVYQSAFGNAGDIVIRHVGLDGKQIGLDYTVSTNDSQNAQSPSIAQLADGRFIVTWTDTTASSDGNGSGIVQQIIDVRDGMVDGKNDPALAESLYGNDTYADQIRGYAGNDTMFGLAGDDALYGGNGNDIMNGGRGDDTAYGGSGLDNIQGGKGDDALFGGDDNDSVNGNGGDDELSGDAGNDVLIGATGEDELNGGSGTDRATYISTRLAVTVALDGSLIGAGEAAGDTFISIENVYGTNISNKGDTIRGDSAVNFLAGLADNDSLNGRAGSDTLWGGAGVDTLTGELGNDSFRYDSLIELGDTVTDFSSAVSGNDDRFLFLRTVFTGNGAALAAGAINATSLITRATDHTAQDGNDFFIYQSNTHELWYDPTGSNTLNDAVLVATLQAGATVGSLDIVMF